MTVLLLFACFTNPSMEDFKVRVKEEFTRKVKAETSNPVLAYIADMGMEFAEQVTEKLVTRHNYIVCSVFTLELPDGNYSYLGAFHMIFPLQEKDPLEVLSKENLK